MLTPTRAHSACVVNDTIYAIGGITGGWGNEGKGSNKVEAYNAELTTGNENKI
jgi:hypothetical protein